MFINRPPDAVDGQDGRAFQFEPIHKPLECCYAHTGVCCRAGGEFVDARAEGEGDVPGETGPENVCANSRQQVNDRA